MALRKNVAARGAGETTPTTYTSLIEAAITDFDNIFEQLVNKKAFLVNDDETITDLVMGNLSDGSVPTSLYSELVKELYRIEGFGTSGSQPTLTATGIVANYDKAGALSLGKSEFTNSGSAITIPVKITAAGYYGTNSSGNLELPLVNPTFDTTSQANFTISTNDNGNYVMTPASQKLFGSVTVTKGSLTVDMEKAEVSHSVTGTSISSTLDYGEVTGDAKLTIVETAPETHGKLLKITMTPTLTATTSVDTNGKGVVTLNNGYITKLTNTSIAKTVENTLDGAAKDFYIDIPMASVSGISHVDVTPKAETGLTLETAAEGAYTISLDCKGSLENATLTPGYINAKTQLSFAEAKHNTKIYIKKGSLGTAETNAMDLTDNLSVGTPTLDTENKKYTIDVGIAKDTKFSKAITEGYVPATAKTFEANLTGAKTISLNQGSATVGYATDKSPKQELTGTVDGISETAGTGDVHLTVKATAGFTKSSIEGYIAAGGTDVSKPADINLTKDIYIKKATFDHSLDIKATRVDKDGKHTTETPAQLFTTTEPTTDHYKVDASETFTVTQAGYIAGSNASPAAGTTLYIPKATFEYVEDSTSGNFIQVKTGGYIPSGVIKNISEITGTMDLASITGTLSLNDKTGDVTLPAPTVNAGYISQSEGTISISTLELGLATVAASLAADPITVSATPVKSGKDTGNHVYTFSGTTNATATAKIDKAGYGKLNTADTSTSTLTASLALNEATLGITDDSAITVAATGNNVRLSATETIFSITPSLATDTVNLHATKAGYIDDVENQSATVALAAAQKAFYIQAATLKAATTTLSATPTLTGKPNTNNSYTVSLNTFKAQSSTTINEGYWNSQDAITSEKDISAESVTIDAASVNASISLTSASVSLKTETDSTIKGVISNSSVTEVGYRYAPITNSVAGTASGSIGTPGYLQTAGQIHGTQDTKTFTSQYLKVIKTKAATFKTSSNAQLQDEGTDNEKFVGTESVKGSGFIGAVNEAEPTCTIDADTMGTGVAAELTRLRQRLTGKLAKTTTI